MVLLCHPSSSSGSSPDTQRKPGVKGGYVTHPFLSFAIEERASDEVEGLLDSRCV